MFCLEKKKLANWNTQFQILIIIAGVLDWELGEAEHQNRLPDKPNINLWIDQPINWALHTRNVVAVCVTATGFSFVLLTEQIAH